MKTIQTQLPTSICFFFLKNLISIYSKQTEHVISCKSINLQKEKKKTQTPQNEKENAAITIHISTKIHAIHDIQTKSSKSCEMLSDCDRTAITRINRERSKEASSNDHKKTNNAENSITSRKQHAC